MSKQRVVIGKIACLLCGEKCDLLEMKGGSRSYYTCDGCDVQVYGRSRLTDSKLRAKLIVVAAPAPPAPAVPAVPVVKKPEPPKREEPKPAAAAKPVTDAAAKPAGWKPAWRRTA